MKSLINIHVFAEVSSECEADIIGSRFSDRLSSFGDTQVTGVKQYWKVPEYFEFSVELSAARLSENDCQKVADVLGHGWSETGSSLIWNPTSDAVLVDPSVKWAHLEYIETQ